MVSLAQVFTESVLKLCREAHRFKKKSKDVLNTFVLSFPHCHTIFSLGSFHLHVFVSLSPCNFHSLVSISVRSVLCSPFPLISSSSSAPPQVQPVVSRSSLTTVPCGVNREEETGRSHSTKKGAFHEVFNLQESERPLPGTSGHCSHKET